MTAEEISALIASLNVGDVVEVHWESEGPASVENGPVWDPADSDFFGVGNSLLDPNDQEIIYIAATSRAPIAEPAIGSVVLWIIQSGTQIQVAKRYATGWKTIGGTLATWTWAQLTGLYGSPVYTQDAP